MIANQKSLYRRLRDARTDMVDHAPNEFSRTVDIDSLEAAPRRLAIEADAQERTDVASRLELPQIRSLMADLTLERRPGKIIMLHGRVSADVDQTCVVTLEPFPTTIEDDFLVVFSANPEPPLAEDGDIQVPLDDEDWAEPLVGDTIDVGEVAVQQLSLALDPYPRAPGAVVAGHTEIGEGHDDAAGRDNPFRDLPNLKK